MRLASSNSSFTARGDIIIWCWCSWRCSTFPRVSFVSGAESFPCPFSCSLWLCISSSLVSKSACFVFNSVFSSRRRFNSTFVALKSANITSTLSSAFSNASFMTRIRSVSTFVISSFSFAFSSPLFALFFLLSFTSCNASASFCLVACNSVKANFPFVASRRSLSIATSALCNRSDKSSHASAISFGRSISISVRTCSFNRSFSSSREASSLMLSASAERRSRFVSKRSVVDVCVVVCVLCECIGSAAIRLSILSILVPTLACDGEGEVTAVVVDVVVFSSASWIKCNFFSVTSSRSSSISASAGIESVDFVSFSVDFWTTFFAGVGVGESIGDGNGEFVITSTDFWISFWRVKWSSINFGVSGVSTKAASLEVWRAALCGVLLLLLLFWFEFFFFFFLPLPIAVALRYVASNFLFSFVCVCSKTNNKKVWLDFEFFATADQTDTQSFQKFSALCRALW